MDNRLFLMDGETAVSVNEQAYAAEDYLQAIVANNPDLLSRAWTDGDNRLFLVKCEQPVYVDGQSWFSLDHLLIGADAVPILVEVKRSSDTRIRREVVSQMLDYACYAAEWDVQKLRVSFEANNVNDAAASELDNDDFWEQVSTNLRAERLRLVFVADEIPASLRQLIEFMDRNMPRMEVYGVAIKQYTSSGGKKLLSVSTIGNPLPEHDLTLSRASVTWDMNSFHDYLVQHSQANYIPIFDELVNFSAEHGLFLQYGTGKKNPTLNLRVDNTFIFTITGWHTNRLGDIVTVEFPLSSIASRFGDRDIEQIRAQLLSNIPDTDEAVSVGKIWNPPKYIYIEFSALMNRGRMEQLKRNIATLIQDLNSGA